MEYQNDLNEIDENRKLDKSVFLMVTLFVFGLFLSLVYIIETISIAIGKESMLFQSPRFK